jgi:TadE-like protein
MGYRARGNASQALVEFALVLPLVVSVSLGIVQVVLYAHARDVLLSSVQEGARLAAEEGRAIDEGAARAQALIGAGLGNSLDGLRLQATLDDELVDVRADALLRPILPLPSLQGLPVSAEARVARERFRPGGGGG